MENSKFKLVIYKPDIPGNTGSIGRTCVALGLDLILIKPYGFDISEKAVRRAGLDYWKHVNIKEYEDWDDFMKHENPEPEKIFLFENNQSQTYYNANYSKDCYLVFGAETKGIDQFVIDQFPDRCFELPMYSEHIRSLNLSNVATTVAYECLRHLYFS
jgi:tRNA (cytidine/uridine-2'-O-)-methyltransferase